MPEYPLKCAKPTCGRFHRVFETVTVYSAHKDKMERSHAELLVRVQDPSLGPVDRSVLLIKINHIDGAIDFPCPSCRHPYSKRVYPPDSAPLVRTEQGTWPETAPSPLAGKSFLSTDEKKEQIRTLTPGLALRENFQEVRAKKIKPHQATTTLADRIVATLKAKKGWSKYTDLASALRVDEAEVRIAVQDKTRFKRAFHSVTAL